MSFYHYDRETAFVPQEEKGKDFSKKPYNRKLNKELYRSKNPQDSIEVTLSDDEFNRFYNSSITFIEKQFQGNSYRVTLSVVDSDVIRVKLSKPQAAAKGVLSSVEGSIGGGAIGAAGGAVLGGVVGGPVGSVVGAGLGAGLGARAAASVTGKDGISYELQANKEKVEDCPVRECFSSMDENAKTNKGRIRVTIVGKLQITPD